MRADDACSGLLSTVKLLTDMEPIYQRTRNNREINTDIIAQEMGLSHGRKRCKNGLRP
jgi:hypothetical protein